MQLFMKKLYEQLKLLNMEKLCIENTGQNDTESRYRQSGCVLKPCITQVQEQL